MKSIIIKERSEYLLNILSEKYSKNFWNVFIYENGYWKVSFSDELYICGKVQNYYVIIFGQNKNNINTEKIIKSEKNNNDEICKNDIIKKYKYHIIDNRMKDNISNNIINLVINSFNMNQATKERTEHIKNRLDEEYPYIYWNVFIYQNGYCKVSFSEELYICGKILKDYIIIFGLYKKVNKCKDSNKDKPRSRIKNQSERRNRSRSRSKDSKEN